MSYRLIKSSNFEKVAKKFLKKYPEKIAAFSLILKLLEQNPFDKSLKTHKLHENFFHCGLQVLILIIEFYIKL